MSVHKYLKRVLPTSEETGLGEAMTRSANENIQKVKEYNKINYTIVPIAIAMHNGIRNSQLASYAVLHNNNKN